MANDAIWVRYAALAYRSQVRLSATGLGELALKKEMVEMIEATKARSIKKCPICPGSKFSPIKFISTKLY
jgi:hypothetical protein